ncbi:retrovirus-related Pol polyprotein from transposon 412 [Trichonephila clavata]|uniref:Retrovirus-related Pol polyprotein from transposon 412 n=1 Tax=Trichonephila clavata TaxID=2740835 RepID=A0A8X6I306_TRICU|nr:retrovirus-related Pol polyprotein from transposon 412 [Trichonephila clavata]
MNNEGSDQEEAPMQLVPVRREIFPKLDVDRVGPLPIIPAGNKYINPDMCMSPRYHEAVLMPDKASTTLVETLLQTFKRRGFPKEFETYKGSLFISILTTKLFQKLGYKYCLSRMPVRFTIDFYYFSKLIAEHLTIELVKSKFVQDSVPYIGPVVRLERRSLAQLKFITIKICPIERNKTQVKGLGVAGCDRQYISMFSCLVAPST